MAKTVREVIEAMAKGKRFTRVEVEDVVETLPDWVENAGTWMERLSAVAEFEMDIDADALGSLEDFQEVAEAIETITAASERAQEISEALEGVSEAWSAMEDHASTWLDEDAEREDRADAREQLEGCAVDLDAAMHQVEQCGINLDEVP